MKQRDAVTRRSRRHATDIVEVRTQQQQQQQLQLQPLNQESLPVTTHVMTRQRKRRCEGTSEQEHLVELSTQKRRRKKQTQAANNQPMCGDKELEEESTRTQSMEESKQSSLETEKTTESQIKCQTENTEQSIKENKHMERTDEPRKLSLSLKRSTKTRVMSKSDQQADQRLETRTLTRKFKEREQTPSDAKNMAESRTVSESKESAQHPVETKARIRRRKEQKQTSFQTESSAKDQDSGVRTVSGKTRGQHRTTQARTDRNVKSVCSENEECDVVAQKTPKTTTTKSLSSDVAKQTPRSTKSTLPEKPESESDPLSESPEHYLSPTDSTDKTKENFAEQASSKDTEDDETKWHNERRTNLTRSIDDAIILQVTCGCRQAELVLNRLESGSRGACVRQSDGSWLTPNEFQLISGRGNAKDWKRSIRHHGHSLKSLVEQGLLSLASPPLCICEYCDLQVSVTKVQSL